MYRFTATDEQVQRLVANAVRASIPVGIGKLMNGPAKIDPSTIEIVNNGTFREVDADYINGRMVKLRLRQKAGETTWEMTKPVDFAHKEYQSWARHYPTIKSLLDSVQGLKIENLGEQEELVSDRKRAELFINPRDPFDRHYLRHGRALRDNGDYGQMMPRSDVNDMAKGARFIPGNVTMERRAGRTVVFVTACSRNCWYWEFEDGSREYHWDPLTYHDIGMRNGKTGKTDKYGSFTFDGGQGAGTCPDCGNVHTSGGRVDKDGNEHR